MVRLNLTQRNEILMMIGYVEKSRTQAPIPQIFNNKYPDCHITQSTVGIVETNFR